MPYYNLRKRPLIIIEGAAKFKIANLLLIYRAQSVKLSIFLKMIELLSYAELS